MKATDEQLLDSYYFGWEISADDKPFPNWFKTDLEKRACLLGYTDFDLSITRESNEILAEIKKK